MSKAKPNVFWDLIFPLGMLIGVAALIIWKSDEMEAFDWLVVVLLTVLLLAKLVEWFRRRFFRKGPENTGDDV